MELDDKVIYVDGKRVEIDDTPYKEEPKYTIETRRVPQSIRERILGPSSCEYFIETYKHWGGKMYCVPSSSPGGFMGGVWTGSQEEVISSEEGPANTDAHIKRCRKHLVVRRWYFFCVYMHKLRDKYTRIKRAITTDDEFMTEEEIDDMRDY